MPKTTQLVSVIAATLLLAGTAAADDIVKVVPASISSLTGKPGDPAAGKKVFLSRKLGNCLACHQVTALADEPFHGEVGPSLDGVASRYKEGELRMQVVNAKVINPDTIMPGFFRVDGLHDVIKNFAGKPILTAEEVEDVVAYVKTFK